MKTKNVLLITILGMVFGYFLGALITYKAPLATCKIDTGEIIDSVKVFKLTVKVGDTVKITEGGKGKSYVISEYPAKNSSIEATILKIY